MPRGYLPSQTTVHFMNYYVWCPKYRRRVIVGKVEEQKC
jgi:REP element-mobilizing transposase RayT